MKKAFKYVLFSFVASFAFLFVGMKVSASDFWTEIGDYSVINVEQEERYYFDKQDSDKYNYKFNYDYVIETTSYILDDGSYITYFYGLTESSTVNYVDIKGTWTNKIKDKFTMYKYNFTTKEFDTDNPVCNPDVNKSGSCNIDQVGLYKLITTGVDGNDKTTYVIYETEFYNMSFESVAYNKETKVVDVSIIIKTPKNLTSCSGIKVLINDVDVGLNGDCNISAIENTYGMYKITLEANKVPNVGVLNDAKISVTLDSNTISIDDAISYDVNSPALVSETDIEYYNKELFMEGFKITKEENAKYVLPKQSVALLKLSDDNAIEKVTINDVDCVVTLLEDKSYSAECLVDSATSGTSLAYKAIDSYGNELVLSMDVTYDTTLLPDGDELMAHIALDADTSTITATFEGEGYEDINAMYVFYGDDLTGAFEKGSDSLSLIPTYRYFGNVTVVVVDNAMNYQTVKLENVSFNNGYSLESFTINVDGDATTEIDITEKLNELLAIACGTDEECKASIKKNVKYGENVEELTGNVLPTYLDILNKKFKDNQCFKEACNKDVEIVVTYNVGNIEQEISMLYKFVDKLPTMETELEIQETLELEYGEFNVETNDMKIALYGDELVVSLIDGNDVRYSGKIVSAFIEYVDRSGNATLLDNLPYTYIGEVNNFGYYMLECKVQILKNETSGVNLEEAMYGKSFFVVVELKDTKIPTLTLVGEKEVTVKQNDVYKDAGYKCDDLSGCNVTVTYYLNDENNKVDSINTKVAGKYIIKFEAIDADGNKAPAAYRTVTVEAINSLNVTSIIIIVVVVLAFAAFITFGILHERKKNKKYQDRGE